MTWHLQTKLGSRQRTLTNRDRGTRSSEEKAAAHGITSFHFSPDEFEVAHNHIWV